MSYVGNKPALKYVNFAVQHFSTSATASYTLDQSVSNEVEIALFINNVRQQPGSSYSYTATGTALTLSQATAGSDTMYCVFIGKAVETNNPPAGSVNTSELVDNAVTTAKITSDSVTYDKIQDLASANRVLGGASTGTVGEVQVVDGMTNFVSTSSASGLQIKGDGTTDGTLQLNCSQNTHGIKIKSPPHSANATYTLTMPTTDGNTSQFLQTNGSGVLTWAEAGGGSLTHLHTATGSNVSSIDINGYFASDYDHYKLIYSLYGATGNTDSMCRIMQSGSVVTASNYWYAGMGMYRSNSSTAENSDGASGAGQWRISSSDNTASVQYPTTGEMILFNPLSTTQNTTMTTTNLGYNSGSPPDAIRIWTFGGQYISTSATSGISFHYDGGNINGTIRLYGVKNS